MSRALARTSGREAVAEVIMTHLVPAVGAYAGAVIEVTPGVELEREPVFVANVAEWTAHFADRPRVMPPDVSDAAWAVLPLLVDDTLLGALLLTFPAPRTFGPEERAYTRALADFCAQALDRARLHETERQTRALSDVVLGSIQDGFVAVDRACRYSYVNRRAAELFGRDADELLGRAVAEVYPQLVDRPIYHALHDAIHAGRSTTIEDFAHSTGGWVEARIAPTGDGASIIFRDVTERRRAEAADRLLASASAALAASLDVGETADAVVRSALPTLADWAMLDLLGEDGALRRAAAAHVDPRKSDAAHDVARRWPADPAWAYGAPAVVRTGEAQLAPEIPPALADGISREPRHRALLETLGLRSYLCVPLLARGRSLGALTLVRGRDAPPYAEADLALARELAARAALALDNARLHTAERVARAAAEGAAERTRQLQALTTALTGAVSPDDVASVALQRARLAFGAVGGLFNLLTDDGREFVQLGAAGLEPEFMRPWRRYRADGGTAGGEVVRTGAPVFVRTIPECTERFPVLVPALVHHGYHAFSVLPMHAGGRLLGIIVFHFAEERRFGETEREQMRAFAGQCALALARANLYQAERRERETAELLSRRLRVLADAGRALAADLDVRATLGAIAGVAVPVIADGCTLDLLSDDGTLERAIHVHRDPRKSELLARSAQVNREVARRTEPEVIARLLAGHGVLIPEVQQEDLERGVPDLAQRAIISQVGIRSYLLVPLVVARRTLGVLSFMITDSAYRYGPDDLALAEELARRSAVALENARLFEAERVARAEAESANQAKMEFLATMSHELRTPLNAIGGHAQLVELEIHGPLTDAQRDALARIQASQAHLLGLINDVLNFAKLDAGKVEFHPTAVPLHETVAAVTALVAPQFTAKAVRHSHCECDAPIVARADADKLRQILLNLLSNAAKYTPSGGEVTIRCVRDGEWARVIVRDTGIGIPPEKVEHIFEPFVQLGRTWSTNLEGTGLGLAISRDLARGMAGDLSVESAVGVGSTFTLALPLA